MSVQSVNYLVDTFGLNSYSVNHVCSVFENHGVSLSEKEEIASLQKFINKIISLADQNGGEATSACISILKAIILNSDVRELENCIVRILDFSKSVVFNCSNWNSKHQGLVVFNHLFNELNNLTNQFVRELLPRLKELVYFHLDLFKRETFVPLFPSILISLSTLIKALNTSIKPIISNIEPVIYALLDNPDESIRQKAIEVIVSLTSSDKTDELWKDTLKKTVTSIQIAINEITGSSDSVLLTLPHLPLPSLSSLGRISPFFAASRLITLISLIQSLFQHNPPTFTIPLFPVISTLLSLLELFVPKGRRTEEASVDGMALSPKEQWLVFPLVYPAVLKAMSVVIDRMGSLILVTIQQLARGLKLFFLRFYREYDIGLTIAVYDTIEHLVLAGGPSVLLLFNDLTKPTLSILRCINTSQDKVVITAGEGKKQGKKNRSKRVYQVGKEENPATISNETFCWSKDPKVSSLYCQCVKFVTVLLQKSRFMTEKDRLDIDLQLFICFSHILSPTSLHKTPFLIHTDSEFRDCMTDAILACCFTCLPSGQLSPVVQLIQPMIRTHSLYSLLSPAQVNSIQALNVMNHTPTQISYRLNENEVTIQVTEVKEEVVEKKESYPRQSVKRAEIPVITREPMMMEKKVEVETIPIQTGIPNQSKETVETVESTMIQLRKLSHDFVEKERRKSMEIAQEVVVPPTPQGDDDYVFSDDGSFDVPDIP